jgi:ribosomal protein L12E/L44/L45/RPP1/RPP2
VKAAAAARQRNYNSCPEAPGESAKREVKEKEEEEEKKKKMYYLSRLEVYRKGLPPEKKSN